jgi:hypothetical protein
VLGNKACHKTVTLISVPDFWAHFTEYLAEVPMNKAYKIDLNKNLKET